MLSVTLYMLRTSLSLPLMIRGIQVHTIPTCRKRDLSADTPRTEVIRQMCRIIPCAWRSAEGREVLACVRPRTRDETGILTSPSKQRWQMPRDSPSVLRRVGFPASIRKPYASVSYYLSADDPSPNKRNTILTGLKAVTLLTPS
jgi:hypothetical protein